MSFHLEHAEVKKERDSNLELYRIIVMFLIVCHHYVVNSGLLPLMSQNPLETKSLFLYIWGMWGKIGINCFVMITGFFMCKSNISLRKFLKLVLQVELYNIVIYSIFIVSGHTSFSITQFIRTILPVTNIANNFTGCYLIFFLCIPFLNILIQNMDKNLHLACIGLGLFIYSILGHVFYVEMNYVSWFCVLYLIASFIRLYPTYREDSCSFWGLMTIISVIMAILSIFVMLYVFPNRYYFFISDSNKMLALIVAVCSFMFFKNLNIKRSQFINNIAACTFGIFLIHTCGDSMREWLWKDLFNNISWYNSDFIYVHAIIIPILIFLCGVLIERVRIRFIEPLLLSFFMAFSISLIAHNKNLVLKK